MPHYNNRKAVIIVYINPIPYIDMSKEFEISTICKAQRNAFDFCIKYFFRHFHYPFS